MQPRVITVHDIHKAIEDVGVSPYANTLVQDMGGEYWFVDADELIEAPSLSENYEVRRIEIPDDTGVKVRFWRYRVVNISLKLAHFIVEVLRLKAQFGRLGVGDIDEPVRQCVYLTPGTKILGREITEWTEIPAKLGPVVVERF